MKSDVEEQFGIHMADFVVLREGQVAVEEWPRLNFLCIYFYMHIMCFLTEGYIPPRPPLPPKLLK